MNSWTSWITITIEQTHYRCQIRFTSMSGYGNKQNCCFWAPNNSHELLQGPLHNAKVIVWCAISSHGIIGPNFFENVKGHTATANAEQYKVMLETFMRMSYVLVSSIWYGSHKKEQLLPQTYRQVLRTTFWYISNEMQHYTVYLFLENCSTCFGWYLHPSSGAHTTVFTVSGTC